MDALIERILKILSTFSMFTNFLFLDVRLDSDCDSVIVNQIQICRAWKARDNRKRISCETICEIARVVARTNLHIMNWLSRPRSRPPGNLSRKNPGARKRRVFIRHVREFSTTRCLSLSLSSRALCRIFPRHREFMRVLVVPCKFYRLLKVKLPPRSNVVFR